MKIILLVIIYFLFTFSLYSQWYYFSNPDMKKFSFPDMTTGYMANRGGLDGIVIKTTNGGDSWVIVFDHSFPYASINGIYFTTTEKGWISTNTEQLFRTTDGGATWTDSMNMQSTGVQILFVNELHGWAFNYANYYRTTNGGENWILYTTNFFPAQTNFYFIDQNTGWFGKHNYSGESKIIKTTDGGITWKSVCTIDPFLINSIFFLNDLTGWIAGNSGLVYKTIDGGDNWFIQNSNLSHPINKIYMINESTGWLGAWGPHIAYTTTGGEAWHPVNKPSGNEEITELKFFDNTGIGFMILGNKLYKTWNNGIFTSVIQTANNIPDKFSLMQNYPNPFNPTTVLKFTLNKKGKVSLKLFDINGREVRDLISEQLNKGEYEYSFDAAGLPSGIYYYKLSDGTQSEAKKMMLVK